MMATRDMSKAQFKAALDRRGFKLGIGGYVDVCHGVHVYRFNAGDKLRAQLAYLIRESKRIQAKRDTSNGQ